MKKTELSINGMHCASCAVLITRGLTKTPGIKFANVNYSAAKALVEYDFNSRASHALTVAREKGILYMGKDYGDDQRKYTRMRNRLFRKIKTGDIVKLVSNGRSGVLVKVRDGVNPLAA